MTINVKINLLRTEAKLYMMHAIFKSIIHKSILQGHHHVKCTYSLCWSGHSFSLPVVHTPKLLITRMLGTNQQMQGAYKHDELYPWQHSYVN